MDKDREKESFGYIGTNELQFRLLTHVPEQPSVSGDNKISNREDFFDAFSAEKKSEL